MIAFVWKRVSIRGFKINRHKFFVHDGGEGSNYFGMIYYSTGNSIDYLENFLYKTSHICTLMILFA